MTKQINIKELQRALAPRPTLFKRAEDGESSPGVLEGVAIAFNTESRDLGGFHEIIDPQALMRTEDGQFDLERNGRVMARLNHDSNLLLATSNSGTLTLSLDEEALRYRIVLPDTQAGRDAAALAARGDLAYSSFAFYILPDGLEWEADEQGNYVVRITALQLVDVAPVSDPAYWSSSVELGRAFDAHRSEEEHSKLPASQDAGENERALSSWVSLQSLAHMGGQQ